MLREAKSNKTGDFNNFVLILWGFLLNKNDADTFYHKKCVSSTRFE